MSSPVHTARCVARDLRSVDLEIGPTTATSVHFPVSELFGLSLLHEASETILYRAPGQMWGARPAAPIASALGFDDIDRMACIDRRDPAKTAMAARFVTR